MIPIYTSEQAKNTILKRKSMIDAVVSPRLRQSIRNLFGTDLQPQEVVTKILEDIKVNGDTAIYSWTAKIDKYTYTNDYELTDDILLSARKNIAEVTIQALTTSIERVLQFHQKQPITGWMTSELGGQVGQVIRPIERVGIYVPGGTAPLPSTVIHTVIPALVAGVKEVIIVSPPPMKDIIKATISLIKEKFSNLRAFQVGGAQAIGALTYGTDVIPKVHKIVGPGNLFVTLAKREVYGLVGIDGLAGPTEAMIIADNTGTSSLIASDLLAQAEHDFLAIPILLTTDPNLAKAVQEEVEKQLASLSRKNIAEVSTESQGGIVIVETLKEAFKLVNQFGPEHLSIVAKNSFQYVDLVTNAGGIFLGESSCEVLGDYIAGPSHVMPTGGSALFNSSLNVSDFIKIVPIIALDNETIKDIAPKAEMIARTETLTAHAEAARRRYDD